MALKDPTAWFEDINHYMDDAELVGTAEAMEPTLVLGAAKVRAAVWVAVVGIFAGALGGVTLSPAIRSSALMFIGYLVGAAILLRGFRPLTRKFFGPGVTWIASTAFFWSFLLGLFAIVAARRDSSVWAYVISVGMGFFIGMMNGSFAPGTVRSEEIWVSVSFPLAPVTLSAATYLLRRMPGSTDTVAGAALGGVIAGGAYTAIMAFAMARLWNEAHGLGQMGLLYLHNDNFAPKAVAYLDRAIALAPNDPKLYNLRGIAWSKAGDPARAASDWNKAAELAPGDAEMYINFSADHMRRGEIDQAIDWLKKGIAADERNAKAHSNIGAAYERRGDLDLAIEHYTKAVGIDKNYANAYSNRAYAYVRRGDHALALADSDRAIKLNDRLAMAHVNRGHALNGLGRAQDAVAAYRYAIDLDPDPTVGDEAYRALEALGYSASDDGDEE